MLKFNSYVNAAKLAGVNNTSISKIGKQCTRLHILLKVLNLLGIDEEEVEKHIVKITDKATCNIMFPFTVSPLLIRLSAHIIGDGGDYKNGARWIQKDTTPIIELQKQILGFHGKKSVNDVGVEQVAIMTIYTKLVCAALKIDRSDLRSEVSKEPPVIDWWDSVKQRVQL